MLLNLLIIFLLSNAITSTRDKSFLYSRVTIRILLLSALITHDNLSLLFLAKGIGIFGGLFQTSATTNTFHIFIFLMTFSLMIPSLITYSEKISVLYFSEPLFITSSDHFLMSGFYSGKGKGKAVDVPDEEKPKSPTEPKMDWEEEKPITKAITDSLKTNKVGESSKSKEGTGNSFVELDFSQKVTKYAEWKASKDMFLEHARLYNDLKIKLDKKTVNSEQDIKLLSYYLDTCNEFKLKKDSIEKVLMHNGIDPSVQDYDSSSDSDKSHSVYSSGSSPERKNKRVKYSNVENTLGFPLGFMLFNITPILRILSYITSAILLLVIHLNILPNLDLCFMKIDLSQVLFLCLIVSLTKLIYKWYSVVITLYNHFLNKDYLIIYFNIYFFIVTILLYFSSNIDICIF